MNQQMAALVSMRSATVTQKDAQRGERERATIPMDTGAALAYRAQTRHARRRWR